MKLLLGLSLFLLSNIGTATVHAKEIDNNSETIVIHWNMESAKNNYIEWDEINSPKSSITKDKDINLIESNVAKNKDINSNEDTDNGPIIIHWRANSADNPEIENPEIENPEIENPNIKNTSDFNSRGNPNIENTSDFNSRGNPNIENTSAFSSRENPNIENTNIKNTYVTRQDPFINWGTDSSIDSTMNSSEEIEIFDDKVIIDGKSYSQEEFMEILQQSDLELIKEPPAVMPIISGAAVMKFALWGLGLATDFIMEEIAGTIIIYAGDKIVDSSSWLYKVLEKSFYELYY